MPAATADLRLKVLDDIKVAAPCPMAWDDMEGDDRKRFCGACELNVYNFSEMTRQEIVDVIGDGSGRVCGRLYRRADGTIITRDCPVGVATLRKKALRVARRVAAAIAVVCSLGFVSHGSTSNGAGKLRGMQPFAWMSEKIAPSTPVPVAPPPVFIAGDIAVPPNWNGQGTCGTGADGADAPS